MYGLENKVVIVTGAASQSGIGYATACKFGQLGAKVCVSDIDMPRLLEREKELKEKGIDAIALEHDVTNEKNWVDLIAKTTDQFGVPDILVNNAGAVSLSGSLSFSYSDWQRQIELNLSSVFLGCRNFIEALVHQGTPGSIVNISSMAGMVGLVNGAAYCASKAGVRLLTKSLALEFARQNIRVNSVHPGAVNTEMAKKALEAEPEKMQAMEAAIPMGRQGEPSEVAALVAFLASNEAKYITGSEFVIDGGLTAQ